MFPAWTVLARTAQQGHRGRRRRATPWAAGCQFLVLRERGQQGKVGKGRAAVGCYMPGATAVASKVQASEEYWVHDL